MTVLRRFESALAPRGGVPDPSQRAALERLERFVGECAEYEAHRNSFASRFVRKPPPRGVYCWGGVGRGKSLLMDSTFAEIPARNKVRLHFHEFIRDAHRAMQTLRGATDPLTEAGREIARRAHWIFLDEFRISDIADAMILHRLLASLLDTGAVLFITSNMAPDALYPDGLHRDRILPAIELLKERLDVLLVDGGVDYRSRALGRFGTWFVGDTADFRMGSVFSALTDGRAEDPVLQIEGREVRARGRADGVAWFDFATLICSPRSYADYLDIAEHFHTVLLSGVPRLAQCTPSEVKRFTWLVDILYDRHGKFVVSAAVPMEELGEGVSGAEYQRTASRLREMQVREAAH